MPVAIENAGIRFPVGYSPWYVYEATVDKDEVLIEFMDLLVPVVGGVFKRPAVQVTAGEPVLTGYCFALEAKSEVTTEDQVIQVAVPGSLVPLIAGGVLRPESLVHMSIGADPFPQTLSVAIGADFAAGRIIGRYRNQNTNAQNLRDSAANDIVYVLTGLA